MTANDEVQPSDVVFQWEREGVKPGFSLERVWSARFRPRLIYMWAVCHDNNLFLTSRRGESGPLTLAVAEPLTWAGWGLNS